MVVANFSFRDKYKKDRFFEKIFLLIETSIEIILGMLYFLLFKADIQFIEKK